VAVGFGLVYSTARFFHFAHGVVYLAGAYTAYALIVLARWPPVVGFCGAIIFGAFLGMLMEVCVYRQLRKRGAPPLVLLLSSLGLLVALQNLVSLIFGDRTLVLRGRPESQVMDILGARITLVQASIIAVSAVAALIVWAILRFTRVGKMFRALANDPQLALVVGVQTDRAILLVFAIGSGLAALAAIMMGYDTDLNPMMGFHALLLGVVATIVGGTGSVAGGFLGGLLVGAAQHLGVWKLPTQWQDAIVFLILILFLLLRPQGFLGKPLRKAAV
jgi:branched-chain amino acid transport system permease protein